MNSPRMPNLLIIGAKKASSTLLYEMLCQHPQVWMPSEKEPHYFSGSMDSPKDRRRYEQLFALAPASAKVIGEASTGYTTLPHNGPTPHRIQQVLGNPKLIYILRDPVERLISNYRHSYLRGWYAPGTTLSQALSSDPILIDTSCYAYQLETYSRTFGEHYVHVMLAEHLHADPVQQMRNVERYLELDPWDGWSDQLPVVNSFGQMAGGHRFRWLRRFKSVRSLAKAVLPQAMKRKIQSRVAAQPDIPTIRDEEREQAYWKIRRDLRWLRSMLGEAIDIWPSTRRLLCENAPVRTATRSSSEIGAASTSSGHSARLVVRSITSPAPLRS